MPFCVTTPVPYREGLGKGLILFEDSIEGNRDIYPLGIGRQEWRYDFMVAFAAREYLALLDYLHHLWREPGLWIICDTNYNKLQCFNLLILQLLQISSWFELCSIVEG